MAAANNGDIYQSTYKGWYSVRDEAYFDEDELTDEGGKRLTPSGAEATWVEEASYFFRLSAYQDRLLEALRGAARLHRPQRAPQRDRRAS